MINLLIFGTGMVSDILIKHYLDLSKANILAFVNSTPIMEKKEGCDVISPKEIQKYVYNYVVIAAEAFDAIFAQCIEVGVPESKIIGIIPFPLLVLMQICFFQFMTDLNFFMIGYQKMGI